ncbi:hypothetical protein GPECTOR_7g1224 [Gonium pectorale]|uniref:Flavin-containing monooxygenase n=1 Tax=Gonium pectorale TaxID=33097 RepID=A0A150GVG1_GONPE|nr:hypothetical protein GPECTOR_7g1224 [Gonium pectorale]|eukprot:KXZ53330.1 hypothetical protein GPECTOR_7g1224 [Gonium pectorale]
MDVLAKVLGYLEAFADFYQLRPLVRTGTRVLAVEPAPGTAPELLARETEPGADISWLITSERLASNGHASSSGSGDSGGGNRVDGSAGPGSAGGVHVQQELYDAVVVCNGHYSEPRLPEVRGAFGSPPAFPGQQLHSHNYRDPEQWRGKLQR